MKTFKIESYGILPNSVQSIVNCYNGKESTKATVEFLNDDIEFCVMNYMDAHGNLNKITREAWLSSRNGTKGFNVTIEW